MTLYDDAYTEYANRNGALTYTYNAVVYSPYDFTSTAFDVLLNSCLNENGAGIRAVFLPNTTSAISMINTDIISMIRGAYYIIQRNWDAYLAIINQITAGTITTTGQISPAWTAYLSTYSNNRITQSTLEQLSISMTRTQSAASRSLNSAFRISTTKDCLVNYSVDVSCSITLTSGQSGTIFLEIASDSGFTQNVQELCRFVNANSGTLTIGLNLVQAVTGTLSGFIPSTYYCRIRTANNTGTPTFNFRSGQEILF